MKVLHVLDSSAPMIAGYSSRSRAIVNTQVELGLDPVVLTSIRHRNDAGLEMEIIDGVRHYRTLRPSAPQRIPLLEMARLYQRTVEIARQEKVELIHAHSPILAGIPAWLAARRLGLKCIYEMRSLWEDAAAEKGEIDPRSTRYRLIRGAETFLMRRVDAVACICEGLRRDVAARGIDAHKLHVVPNGVDPARFVARQRDADTARRLGLEGKTVVGYIGTFFGFEGVVDLVRAIAKIVKSGRDDVAGLIVGRGATYEACRETAAELGVEAQIVHPGHVDPDEVESMYSVLDILVYPRRQFRITELVTPLKPLEAMAMEKAVIGSDVGGIAELIADEKTGLLFRSGDVDDLARQILRLVDDAALRQEFGHTARRWIETERDWRSIVPTYSHIYAAVLDAQADGPGTGVAS